MLQVRSLITNEIHFRKKWLVEPLGFKKTGFVKSQTLPVCWGDKKPFHVWKRLLSLSMFPMKDEHYLRHTEGKTEWQYRPLPCSKWWFTQIRQLSLQLLLSLSLLLCPCDPGGQRWRDHNQEVTTPEPALPHQVVLFGLTESRRHTEAPVWFEPTVPFDVTGSLSRNIEV